NTVVFSSTFVPRSLVKKPLAMPTSAGSWVMFARKPSRSTTGPEPEPEAPVADEAQPAARRVIAATPAARSTRLIQIHLSDQFSIQINLVENMAGHNLIRQKHEVSALAQARACAPVPEHRPRGGALTCGACPRSPRKKTAPTGVSFPVPARYPPWPLRLFIMASVYRCRGPANPAELMIQPGCSTDQPSLLPGWLALPAPQTPKCWSVATWLSVVTR